MGHNTREVRDDANILSLNFDVLLALSSQLSVLLKLCIMNTHLHFLLCQSCCSLRNVSLGGPHIPFLGLIRRPCYSWLSMMTSSESPFFSLSTGSPTLSPPLALPYSLPSCKSFTPLRLKTQALARENREIFWRPNVAVQQ